MKNKLSKVIHYAFYVMTFASISMFYYKFFDFFTSNVLNLSGEDMNVASLIMLLVYIVLIFPICLLAIRYLKIKLED